MACFRNILAGVHLVRPDPPDPPDALALGPCLRDAVRRALWLAGRCSARLTFLAALADGADAAGPVLSDLVRQADEAGIPARAEVAAGKAPVALIRQVQRDRHDLVVFGRHDGGGLRRLLLGDTARRLLHECPCPVWVAKPGAGAAPANLLVASDLSPLAEGALRLALELAPAIGARVHLLHVLFYPLDRVWSTGLPDPAAQAYRRQVRASAEQTLRAQLERNGYRPFQADVQVHLVDGNGLADDAILQFIKDHAIDLLVIGEAGRGGLERLLLGDMAERLLPDVPCAVLAVKP